MIKKLILASIVISSALICVITPALGQQECIWNVGDPHKMHWPQLPDEDGWDVMATEPIVLADDFLCTETGPITDVHFWGSWRNGEVGTIDTFWLSFHRNIPADMNPEGFSKPGETLWETPVPIEFVNVIPIDATVMEGWYDPSQPEILLDDHSEYFQYNICFWEFLDAADLFYQMQDSIYWLNISAVTSDPGTAMLWGWKSTEDHWEDDAVWAYWGELDWQEIYEPGTALEPISNDFWIEFDNIGAPVPPTTGGTDYYDDGTSLNGWYFYPNTGWWNIWFYDHPFDPERYKEIYIVFEWFPTTEPYWIEMAINWATPDWPPGLPPPIPPLTPAEEDMYIWRDWVPIGPPGPFEYTLVVPDYNPEWVSVDIMGQNVIIPQGTITHQCLPADSVSLDLAFVITSEWPCEPDIDVDKTVWDNNVGGWVDYIDMTIGDTAQFQVVVTNTGTCCDLTNILITDTLDDSFEFVDAIPYPESVEPFPGGTVLRWFIPGPMAVSDVEYFEIYAEVLGPHCHVDTNRVHVQAECDSPTPETVSDYDDAAVHAVARLIDFGDLPDPTFPTLLANDGARHEIVSYIHLGNWIDMEPDGQPSADALADDINPAVGLDDEDGVVFITPTIQGMAATLKVYASVDGYLNAWIDWTRDGDFDDYVEQVFTDQAVVAGDNYFNIVIPSSAVIGITYGRFRFNTTGGLGYDGPADDGEVEDYRIFIGRPIEDIKMHWEQWPDLDETGMDVEMFWFELADDFLCTESGPILDIHFWGSFENDILPIDGPGSLQFWIQIYSDIPADQNPNGPWSQPGESLWDKTFYPGDYVVTQVADNNPEDWYDPNPAGVTWVDNNHFNAYRYDFFIPEDSAYDQEEGRIYWLAIKHIIPAEPNYRFGWKTANYDLRWNDDATYLLDAPWLWMPMTYPLGHEYMEQTLDLAFVITGGDQWICGDASGDGAVDIDDVVFLIAYIFSGGPPPDPIASGDVNCSDGANPIDIDDVVYLINYIFAGGPPPCDPNGDGVPDC